MRHGGRVRLWGAPVACAAAAIALSLCAPASAAPAPAKKPTIFGIWMAAYAPGGDERWRTTPFAPTPQFTPWGKAESDKWNTHETPGQCDPWTPVNFMGAGGLFPIQILDGINQIVILHEVVVAPRHIYTDGREHPAPDEIDPTFMGNSIGHWEGDTLVVDTIGLNGRARPLNGFPSGAVNSPTATDARLPASDQTHIVERYRLLEGGEIMQGVFTISDPKTYTTPSFSTTRYYRRTPNVDLTEYVCTDNERDRDEGQTHR